MCEEITKTLDILLFASENYWWGVDVYFVRFVKWGIKEEHLHPLKQKRKKSILSVVPEFGVDSNGQLIPAIPLTGAANAFDYRSFCGTAVFLGRNQTNFAVLADEVIGTETLNIPEQIRLLPGHLKNVFSGRNIWAVAEIRENLAYLFEPPVG